MNDDFFYHFLSLCFFGYSHFSILLLFVPRVDLIGDETSLDTFLDTYLGLHSLQKRLNWDVISLDMTLSLQTCLRRLVLKHYKNNLIGNETSLDTF